MTRSEEARQFLMELNGERERTKHLSSALGRAVAALNTLDRILQGTRNEIAEAIAKAECRNA